MGPLDVLRSWTVQDSPPGAATAALVARAENLPVGWLERALYEERSAVALYNPRSATAIVPADEAGAFGTAFLPREPEPEAELAIEAISDALDGRALSRDDLHEELRQRLPTALLPWCPGCKSHHARRGLLIIAGLHGRLCIAGRAGRQPAFARTDQLVGWDPPPRELAAAELVRRYHAQYGASSASAFADWAGIARPHAQEMWFGADGGERLDGVRLLAPGDPILLGRERAALVPDPEVRKTIWKAIGGAGVITVDGAVVAVWRARKRGKTLVLAVEGDAPRKPLEAAARRLAPHRGCETAEVRLEPIASL